MEKFRVIDYFDVWGNTEDGWDVNNLCEAGEVEIEDTSNSQQLLNAAIEIGMLKDTVKLSDLDIWNDYEMIEFYAGEDAGEEALKPLFRFELIHD